MMERGVTYNYAIDGVEENAFNSEILNINYGAGKVPLNIFKKDIERFVRAIISPEEMEKRKIAQMLEEDDGKQLEALNYCLKGRAMILVTTFFNYFEWANKGQNQICEIAALRMDGRIAWEDAFPYYKLEPSWENLHGSK